MILFLWWNYCRSQMHINSFQYILYLRIFSQWPCVENVAAGHKLHLKHQCSNKTSKWEESQKLLQVLGVWAASSTWILSGCSQYYSIKHRESEGLSNRLSNSSLIQTFDSKMTPTFTEKWDINLIHLSFSVIFSSFILVAVKQTSQWLEQQTDRRKWLLNAYWQV